jgi:ABC-type sugar transport system substrate-binding protein
VFNGQKLRETKVAENLKRHTEGYTYMKRIFALALLFALTGTAISGIGSAAAAVEPPPGISKESYASKLLAKFSKKPTVAISVVQFNNVTIQSWMDAMRHGADLHGINLIIEDGQNDAAKQTSQYENFIAQKVDLILVDPVDAKAIVPVVKRINEAHIPVINYDAPAEGGNFVTSVYMDWLMAGIMSGVQIVEATGGKGNVVLVEGTPGFAAQFLRTKGIELVLSAYPDLKIVAKQTGMFNRAEGLKVTEQLLQAQQNVNAWYFQNDEMFFGGIKAIKAAGKRDGMKILSVDGNPEALKAIGAGDLDYEVVGGFNLQGWLVMETAAKVLMGEKVPDKIVVPLTMADKSNWDKVRPAWEAVSAK